MTCKYAYDMGHDYKPLCERGSTPVPAHCDRCDYRYEELEHENERLRDAVKYLYGFAKTLGVDAEDMRERGIEVD